MSLKALFSPRGVAVIGASTKPGKNGYTFTKALLEGGFAGQTYPVNPGGGELNGKPFYRSLSEVEGPVDLALILVNKNLAQQAVEECAAKGVQVAVMYTAGFAEMGEEGLRRQRQMIAAANARGLRIVGPNCMGMYSGPEKLNLTGEPIPEGEIALISQSGNIGFSLWYEAETYYHTGFSRFVGFGNQADIALHEYIDFCADDPHSKVIAIYVEGLRADSGLDFIRAASRAAARKPVVILKGGRTQAGSRAASSHTGSLAGNDALYQAAFAKAGIVEVQRLDELIPVAQALLLCQQPLLGQQIAVCGTGGGHMIVCTDAAERQGFVLPPFTEGTNRRIADLLYDFAPKGNPFDQAGTFLDNMDVWSQTAEAVLAEEQIQGMFLFGNIGYKPQHQTDGVGWPEAMRNLAQVRDRYHKPVLGFALRAREQSPCNEALYDCGMPVFDSPDTAMRAMKALWERQQFAATRREIAALPQRTGAAPACFTTASRRPARNLTEPEAYGLLEQYGISLAPYRFATSLEQALEQGEELGYPLVLKIVSPQIIHKTEVGGVRRNIGSASELRAAYESLLADCAVKAPEADLQGVLLAKQVSGVELIAGIVRDAQFGPVLMLGLGGVFVEILKDVNFCILPTDAAEIRAKLAGLKGYPLLTGARGGKPVNLDALVALLLRLARVAAENPEIAELDLNPIFVDQQGAYAADARLMVR